MFRSHDDDHLGYLDPGQSPSSETSLHNSGTLITRRPMGSSSLSSRTLQSVSAGFAKGPTTTTSWGATTAPQLGASTGSEELRQHFEYPSTYTIDRPSGNYLVIPSHRAGTPFSSGSLGTATDDASSHIASSLSSRPTTLSTASNTTFKVEDSETLAITGNNNQASDETEDEFAVTKAEAEATIANVPTLGPCSKVWVLPPVHDPSI